MIDKLPMGFLLCYSWFPQVIFRMKAAQSQVAIKNCWKREAASSVVSMRLFLCRNCKICVFNRLFGLAFRRHLNSYSHFPKTAVLGQFNHFFFSLLVPNKNGGKSSWTTAIIWLQIHNTNQEVLSRFRNISTMFVAFLFVCLLRIWLMQNIPFAAQLQ